MTDLVIRPLQSGDFDSWLPLWREYHEDDVDHAENAEIVFNHLLDPATPLEGLLAFKNGFAVGIAHLVYYPSTYKYGKNIAYLEDLGVSKEHRSQGIGKSLIDEGIKRAKEKGFARFFWMTMPDNEKAQGLYNQYTNPETWLRYAIEL